MSQTTIHVGGSGAASGAPAPATRALAPSSYALPMRTRFLPGEDAPLPSGGLLAVLDGLLRMPANLMHSVARSRATLAKLLAVLAIGMAVAGGFVGGFSGGLQLVVVPLKLALGMVFCCVICLPSLHVFACLAGADVRLRQSAGALLAGAALTAVLLVGFAPVSWVFSQATDAAGVVGGLHIVFLMISAHFGLRLTRRALADAAGGRIPALGLWSLVFLLVLFQMSTTLRPLVGPYAGLAFAPKAFFLTHWLGLG